jgi:hypothetical protein
MAVSNKSTYIVVQILALCRLFGKGFSGDVLEARVPSLSLDSIL